MRPIAVLATLLLVALAGTGAAAAPDASPSVTQRGLTDPGIKAAQQPDPNEQGVRSPDPDTDAENQTPRLADALDAVRRAPPGLDGTPIPRPNPWASEPDDPHEPTRSANPSEQVSQEVH